jgi:hypothetical protein
MASDKSAARRLMELGGTMPDLDVPLKIMISDYEELLERIRLLNNIALSAVALRISIEAGFKPDLHALSRDLDAYQRRFGGVLEPR